MSIVPVSDKVKRHPHTASQAVVAVLTIVVVKLAGKDVADNYAWLIMFAAPVIVAKVNERFTVPWNQVLKQIQTLNDRHARGNDSFIDPEGFHGM